MNKIEVCEVDKYRVEVKPVNVLPIVEDLMSQIKNDSRLIGPCASAAYRKTITLCKVKIVVDIIKTHFHKRKIDRKFIDKLSLSLFGSLINVNNLYRDIGSKIKIYRTNYGKSVDIDFNFSNEFIEEIEYNFELHKEKIKSFLDDFNAKNKSNKSRFVKVKI